MRGNVTLHHMRKKKDKYVSFWDKIIYVIAVVQPFMALPQLAKLFLEKNAEGVSLLSWGSFLVTSFVWLGYGCVHKEKPIIITNALWAVFDLLIVIGILMHT